MAKRISKSAINWVEMAKRVPPEQKVNFIAFKGKSDGYLRRVHANPESPPKINWEEYKKLIPDAALVDKFKSAYESINVPYPKDDLSAKVDEQWKSLEGEIKKFSEDMKKKIATAGQELARIKALPKYEDMTMEMYADMFPNEAIKPVEKPTFWPHTPDEQLDYVDPTSRAQQGH